MPGAAAVMTASVETESMSARERRCAVTRAVLPAAEMVRFVVGPDGALCPDIEERLPGRGLWMTAGRDIVAAARSGPLAKAVHGPVGVPDGLADLVERLLARRCLDLLGLARRAGQAVGGSEKVSEWLRAGRGRVILSAVDGALGGRGKVHALARGTPHLVVLTRAELGSVFGRDDCVHAVVAASPLADRILRDGRRLAGFRATAKEVSSERSDGRA
jgi:predicted RNA-binding protein YlxR (DUF448 family)